MSNNNAEETKEFNLENIFAENEYSIPIYQRDYAWENKQIEQLLTDIYDSTPDSKYYLGTLIVDKISPGSFTVIDGQQRLTTIFLLLIYFKNRHQVKNFSKNSLRFEAREKSNRTLQDLYDLPQNQEIENDGFYSEEIINGFNITKRFFESEEAKKENYLNDFCSKLKNIFIIRVQVPKQIDLNHYFEIMNTRGEQLEIHEIAKGRILSAIKDESDRNIAAKIWDSCAQMDTYIQMNFDKTTRQNLFGENWNDFKYNQFSDLRDKFSVNSAESNKFSLIEKLEKPEISDDGKNKNISDEENERFESIVSFPNFLLIVNEALQNSSGEKDSSLDDKNFLKTMEKNWKGESNNEQNDNALKFIFSLLKYRFLFDKFILKREFAKNYADDGKWSLQRLEKYQEKPLYKLTFSSDENENDEKTEQLRSLQSALRITYTSPKTMHWISKALSALGENQNADLIEILENYACKKIMEANYLEAKGFGIERIVFTYLDYVLLRDKKVDIPNFQFQFRTSIEHFYPQHPQHPDKNKTWSADSLNSFGNLALITVSANSKFSNFDPSEKVSTYPETISQSPKLQIMADEMKSNKNGWSENLAKKHNDEMLRILTKEIENKLRKI